MAQRLLDANIELVAYNRTPENWNHRAAGAAIVEHPMRLFMLAECVILMLTNASAIRKCLQTVPGNSWQDEQ